MPLTNTEFEALYALCESLDEVAEKSGYSRAYVQARASKLRSMNYCLKTFPRGRPRKYGGGIVHKHGRQPIPVSAELQEAYAALAAARARVLELERAGQAEREAERAAWLEHERDVVARHRAMGAKVVDVNHGTV